MNILVSQTQTAAIVYFELKEQLEKEIDNLLNEYRKKCIVAYCEVYIEYKNKISFTEIYPRFLLCNIDFQTRLKEFDYDISKLKELLNVCYLNWKYQYSISTFSTFKPYGGVQSQNTIIVQFEDDEVIFDLTKTDLFDNEVMNQEIEKFKHQLNLMFNYKIIDEQKYIRQKIAELQAKLI